MVPEALPEEDLQFSKLRKPALQEEYKETEEKTGVLNKPPSRNSMLLNPSYAWALPSGRWVGKTLGDSQPNGTTEGDFECEESEL